MIKSNYIWHGDKIAASLRAASWEGVQRATVFFANKCQEEVNISNPRPYKTPSQPGEPPRKRTGFGQRNIRYELNKSQGWGRVGVARNAIYMLFLDLGTRYIKPRPWLVATLRKYIDAIKAQAQVK